MVCFFITLYTVRVLYLTVVVRVADIATDQSGASILMGLLFVNKGFNRSIVHEQRD